VNQEVMDSSARYRVNFLPYTDPLVPGVGNRTNNLGVRKPGQQVNSILVLLGQHY